MKETFSRGCCGTSLSMIYAAVHDATATATTSHDSNTNGINATGSDCARFTCPSTCCTPNSFSNATELDTI